MLMKISSEISVARKLMVMNLLTNYEGGLILESFSLWLKSPKKDGDTPELMLRNLEPPFFEDLNQSEK